MQIRHEADEETHISVLKQERVVGNARYDLHALDLWHSPHNIVLFEFEKDQALGLSKQHRIPFSESIPRAADFNYVQNFLPSQSPFYKADNMSSSAKYPPSNNVFNYGLLFCCTSNLTS